MSADRWFALACVTWNLAWALAVWLRGRRRGADFAKRIANTYRLPWESP